MHWKTLKFMGVYVLILGITVEVVTKADIGHFLMSGGSLVILIGANMRLIDYKKRYYKLLEKYKKRGGD